MRKALIASAVLMAAGLVMAAGRPGVVQTRDGVVYDGSVDERDDGTVVINVRGIETSVPRESIASINYGDFETRWNEQYAKLAATDVDGRIAMGRKAFDEHKYDLAEKASRDAQAIDANSTAAAELLKLTQNQRRLESGTTPSGNPTTPAATGSAAKPAPQWKTLTAEQINQVKQVEFQVSDTKVRVNFKNNVMKKFVDANPNKYKNFTEFQSQSLADRAEQILKGGGELTKDVEIVNDPSVILAFRKDVLPVVLQGCATSACHGGNNDASKAFALITPANDTPIVYTNFYLLQSYKKTVPSTEGGDSMFKSPSAYMINRTQAADSLLLEYSLPEASATLKHPHVRGFNGIVRNKEDGKYKAIQNFIVSLNQVDPDYGFTFKLERQGGEPASEPTPAATPTPAPTPTPAGSPKPATKPAMPGPAARPPAPAK